MRRKISKLKVFPNPWGVDPRTLFRKNRETGKVEAIANVVAERFTMDAKGRPNGIVLQEVSDRFAPTVARYVGARLDEVNTFKLEEFEHFNHVRSEPQQTVFAFMGVSADESEPLELAEKLVRKEPIELTASRYYMDRIRAGELLPADESTARFAAVRFVEPKLLIPMLAEAAVAAFNQQYEEGDAYLEFIQERNEAKSARKAAAAKAKRDKDRARAERKAKGVDIPEPEPEPEPNAESEDPDSEFE